MSAKSYKAYEEARGRAMAGGVRLGVLLSAVALLFPWGCWLVLTYLEPPSWVVWVAPGRCLLGLLFLAVSGLLAHGAIVEGRRTALFNEEAERLRWQAQAEEDQPSLVAAGGGPPGGGTGRGPAGDGLSAQERG